MEKNTYSPDKSPIDLIMILVIGTIFVLFSQLPETDGAVIPWHFSTEV